MKFPAILRIWINERNGILKTFLVLFLIPSFLSNALSLGWDDDVSQRWKMEKPTGEIWTRSKVLLAEGGWRVGRRRNKKRKRKNNLLSSLVRDFSGCCFTHTHIAASLLLAEKKEKNFESYWLEFLIFPFTSLETWALSKLNAAERRNHHHRLGKSPPSIDCVWIHVYQMRANTIADIVKLCSYSMLCVVHNLSNHIVGPSSEFELILA